MERIPLTQGLFAIVDKEDYERLNKHKWHASYDGNGLYASTNIVDGLNRKTLKMHRFIMNAQKGQMIDHINGNGLDNRKVNLRFCTRSQNGANRRACGTSKYLGVNWHKATLRWAAQITVNGKKKYLGVFTNEQEAATAYNQAACAYHKEFAKLNIIDNFN